MVLYNALRGQNQAAPLYELVFNKYTASALAIFIIAVLSVAAFVYLKNSGTILPNKTVKSRDGSK